MLLLFEPLQFDLLLVELVLQRLELLITLGRGRLVQPLLVHLLLLLVQSKLEGSQLFGRRSSGLGKRCGRQDGSNNSEEALHDPQMGMAKAGGQIAPALLN